MTDEKRNLGQKDKQYMKTIFIAYNQAYNMELADILEAHGCKGYTMWNEITGRGSETGEPHQGTHAWPLAVVPDEKVDCILDGLSAKNTEYPELGLRAFVWNVEKSI